MLFRSDVTISSTLHHLSYQCILGGIQRMQRKISDIVVICRDGFDLPTNHMNLHVSDITGMQKVSPIILHKLFFNNHVISTLGSDNNIPIDGYTGLQFTLEPYKQYEIYIYLRSDSEQSKNDGSESKFGTKVDIV